MNAHRQRPAATVHSRTAHDGGDIRPRRFGTAWLALTLALALHVWDEAAHDFLAVYNPAVIAIRERLPFLPLPTFDFAGWITGLCLGIAALLAVSPLAFRGARWIVYAAFPFAAVMLANGIGHITLSLYMGAFMPGVWSSPLLLVASLHLFRTAWRLRAG